jgi:homogentisate 1,2-dioxygenase
LFGTEGFHGHASLSYHAHTNASKRNPKSYSVEPKIAIGKNIKSLLLKGFELKPSDDFRKPQPCLLIKIVHRTRSAPRKSLTDYFYKNADADELIFIHKGKENYAPCGNIPFEYGDYLIIPRGIIY